MGLFLFISPTFEIGLSLLGASTFAVVLSLFTSVTFKIGVGEFSIELILFKSSSNFLNAC